MSEAAASMAVAIVSEEAASGAGVSGTEASETDRRRGRPQFLRQSP